MFTLKAIIRNRFAPFILPILSALFAMAMLATVTSPAYAYVKYGRWSGRSSEFRNYISGAPFPTNATALVANAAAKWSQASTGKKFTLYNYQNISGPVRISTAGANFPAHNWPDIWPAYTLVSFNTNGYLSSTTIYVNKSWSWNTACTLNQSKKQADFRVIITHELGHTVSLNHDPNHTEAIMWPDFTCKLNLTADDKNGIGALYP
ncbi:MAG: matrixin family metalloprotease [Anaerolineales bacterium]